MSYTGEQSFYNFQKNRIICLTVGKFIFQTGLTLLIISWICKKTLKLARRLNNQTKVQNPIQNDKISFGRKINNVRKGLVNKYLIRAEIRSKICERDFLLDEKSSGLFGQKTNLVLAL